MSVPKLACSSAPDPTSCASMLMSACSAGNNACQRLIVQLLLMTPVLHERDAAVPLLHQHQIYDAPPHCQGPRLVTAVSALAV